MFQYKLFREQFQLLNRKKMFHTICLCFFFAKRSRKFQQDCPCMFKEKEATEFWFTTAHETNMQFWIHVHASSFFFFFGVEGQVNHQWNGMIFQEHKGRKNKWGRESQCRTSPLYRHICRALVQLRCQGQRRKLRLVNPGEEHCPGFSCQNRGTHSSWSHAGDQTVTMQNLSHDFLF